MEALALFNHHCHQPLCSSLHHYCPSLRSSMSSFFLSHPSTSRSIRASSSSSPSPPPPSSDPTRQNLETLETQSSQFPNYVHKFASFATVATASAFLFLGFCRNAMINKNPITLPPTSFLLEAINEGSIVEDLNNKPDHVQSILFLKLKEKIPIVHSFTRTKNDDQAWQVLKAEVLSCGEDLEEVKIGFEEILAKDSCCNKDYHDRILQCLEMIDECKGFLKDIKKVMDKCERENGDMKYYLRFLNNVVARIRVLEGDMVDALKYFQELQQE